MNDLWRDALEVFAIVTAFGLALVVVVAVACLVAAGLRLVPL